MVLISAAGQSDIYICVYISEKAMAPNSSTLAWTIPWIGGAWWAAVHGVPKSQTRLSDFTFTFHFHALEKEMATHSSVYVYIHIYILFQVLFHNDLSQDC